MSVHVRIKGHITELLYEQEGRCFVCGLPVHIKRNRRMNPQWPHFPTRDHFIPKAWGGSNERINLVVSHRMCNSLRADRLPTEDQMRAFLKYKGRLAGIAHLKHLAWLIEIRLRGYPVAAE